MRPGRNEQSGWPLSALVALTVFVPAACSQDDSTGDIALATYDAPGGAGNAAIAGGGVMDFTDGCVVAESEHGKRILLAWPNDRTAVVDGSIRLESESGQVVMSEGDPVTIGGTTLDSPEDEGEDGGVGVDWVQPPDESCDYDEIASVNSVMKDD